MANRRKGPRHCDKPMRLVIVPTMVAVFNPYKAIAGDRRWVKNHDEHRAFLREFNYEEVGNDKSYAPPDRHPQEQAYLDAQEKKELDSSFKQQDAILKQLGD